MVKFVQTSVVLLLIAGGAIGEEKKADGMLFKLRSRAQVGDTDRYNVVMKEEIWQPNQTAIIVCDMWDTHTCLNAVRRVVEMAPRMNEVLDKARAQGVFIIHAPSNCMDTYKDHPGRKLAQSAPTAANLPKDIASWCYKIPAEEKGKYPLDQTEPCDSDPVEQAAHTEKLKEMGRDLKRPWVKQIDVLKIHDGDAITDSGVETWNMLEQRGIKNVILVGVHTNMCVLGRPFGLRQMSKNGKNVVLMRDMTDTMYNPKKEPFVSHFKGTELIIEHIEKYVCPTVTSDQVLGGSEFKFKGAE